MSIMNQAAAFYCVDICTRHSARLSRLLTAGTKSLLSLIAGDTLGKIPVHTALEANKQGNAIHDLGASFVNQAQNIQPPPPQIQPNSAAYEGQSVGIYSAFSPQQ